MPVPACLTSLRLVLSDDQPWVTFSSFTGETLTSVIPKAVELPKASGLTEEAPVAGKDPYRGCSAHSTHPTFFWGVCPWNYGSVTSPRFIRNVTASDVVPENESGTPGCRCSAGRGRVHEVALLCEMEISAHGI